MSAAIQKAQNITMQGRPLHAHARSKFFDVIRRRKKLRFFSLKEYAYAILVSMSASTWRPMMARRGSKMYAKLLSMGPKNVPQKVQREK